jgi:DNA-binding NtrC family response regulator/tetratricopeptide (TPR) repeat protein
VYFAGDVLADPARMMTCHYTLVADRFLQLPDRRTLDLATGEEVWLQIEDDAPISSEWTERCAALYVRRHPQLVELLDYGALGRAARFEAFRTHGPLRGWTSGDAEATRALEYAAAFLTGQGLSSGQLGRPRLVDVAGEPRLLADETTGLRLDVEGTVGNAVGLGSQSGRENFRRAGVVLQPRLAIGQIMDFLEEPWTSGTRWLELRAPSGAGASTSLRLVAREARLRGFVPISTSLFSRVEWPERGGDVVQQLPDTCAGRHLVLLNDRSDHLESTEQKTDRIVRCILRLCAVERCPQIAVVSVADSSEQPTSPWVALDPLTADELRATIGARLSANSIERRLACAIRASGGWPGRFLRALGVLEEQHGRTEAARERATAFTARIEDRAADTPATNGADLDGWKRLVEARGLGRRGRHAAAARTFREAVSMFERRGDQLHAGTAWYELGQLCLLRGALDAARRGFEQAGQRFRLAGATGRVIAATAGEGLARMEAGQLREAETILRAADLPIAQVRDSHEGVLVRTALVRCLSWQGRSEEAAALTHDERGSVTERSPAADHVLNVSEAAEESGRLARVTSARSAEWHAALARVALQRRALDDAAEHVKAALTAARDDQLLGTCAAHTAAVSLHGCIGDAEAANLHAARGLDAARAAHAPLEATRLRISLVMALDQAGARSDARRLALRLLRLRHPKIPALLNAELGMALASALPEIPAARSHGEQAAAFARAAGASGLLPVTSGPHGVPRPLSDIIDMLRSTEEYEDEADLLERVGQLLRSRLGALSVAFVPADDPETSLVATGSGRGAGAGRALAAGVLIGPLRTSAGVEIAAPIRCGGATVGALGCRWSAAGPDNADHARALIATTAVVSGAFLKAIVDRRRVRPPEADCPDLVGVSAAMIDLRRAIARAASAPFPVLIVGESGVGKELVARAIHRGSPRRLRNFAALNCAALTEELVDSELFGHARGAFTGAVAERRGIFEEADGGTLFLDEVSELSPRAQAKLLRVLQDGEVRRVGESFARHIDVRVIAATNRALDAASAERQFRQDLRYRLDVIRIEVPPLRHRIEDIPVLATAFWTRVAPLTGCQATLGPAAVAALVRHDWPGNVRELQNVISSLVVSAPRRGVVPASALSAAIARCATATPLTTLEDARLAFERHFVAAAVARTGGKTSQAARDLGVTRQGLGKLVKRLGIGGIQTTEGGIQNKKLEDANEDSKDVH